MDSLLQILTKAQKEKWPDQVLANTMLNALGHEPAVTPRTVTFQRGPDKPEGQNTRPRHTAQ